MVKVRVYDGSWEYFMLEAYCLGKSFWWNCFFGWRKTRNNWLYYIIPIRAWEMIQKSAEKISNVMGYDGI